MKPQLSLLKECFSLHRLKPHDPIPEIVWRQQFFSITRTPDELSVVVQEDVGLPGTRSAAGWSCIKVLGPLDATDALSRFNVSVKVMGGGINGQAGAIQLGIARALLEVNPDLRPVLRQKGFLTRDVRAKERKKPGLKSARKAPQYTKR